MNRDESFGMYLSARIHAKRTAFLGQSLLEEILGHNDIGVTIKYLLNSPYGQDLAEALTMFEGADAVEEALARNMDRTFQETLDMVRGDRGTMGLAVIFLARWDLAAAKSLLRQSLLGIKENERRPALVPGPMLRTPVLREFSEIEPPNALVSALAAWRPRMFGCMLRVMEQSSGAEPDASLVVALEETLDRHYFLRSLAGLGNDENEDLLRHMLRMEIDRINLRNLFRGLQKTGTDEPREDRFLAGGHLSHDVLAEMVKASSIDQAMYLLEKTPYRLLHRDLYRVLQTGKSATIDRRFEWLFVDALKLMIRAHAFSIAIFMHYVWLKHIEVVNLRVIARGAAAKAPVGGIREELVYA